MTILSQGHSLFRISLIGLSLALGVPLSAHAELTVDITQGNVKPMPIAITSLYGQTPALAELGAKISAIIDADLERCGLFQPIDPSTFVQGLDSLKQQGPRFGDWRLINAQTLVKGEVKAIGDGRFKAEFRLFDVIAEVQLEGLVFTSTPADYRRIAHKMADAIYQRITGDKGYFDTKIIYVSQTGSVTRKQKRLAIMDQDGANHRFITSGQSEVLTPRFSPSGQEIAYLDFIRRKPQVYFMNIATGQRRLLGNFKGMTFAPRFSMDGSSVIMSFAAQGRTSLYEMGILSKQVTRLTQGPQIDTSPCYSPDGQKIVFNSDRGGSPQIYLISARGGHAERISFGKGIYSMPVWSPRGDLIAFAKQEGKIFSIGVMKIDGSGERILTRGHMVEDPCWSPNGRVIMFTRTDRQGTSSMWTIDLTGYNERQVPTPKEGRGACWSPLIP